MPVRVPACLVACRVVCGLVCGCAPVGVSLLIDRGVLPSVLEGML
jgi:hypothetical protein